MDWTEPWLLAAFAFFAAVQTWFIVMLIVTGRRYRRMVSAFPQSGPDCEPSDVSFEELGLLAHGDRRLAEVALCRLRLEGHVKVDGLVSLADDPGERPTMGGRRSVREAILDRLRRRRPAYLEDVLDAGQHRGDCSDARRRLIELGLRDEEVERLDEAGVRVFGAYALLNAAGAVAVAMGLGAAVREPDAERVITRIVLVVSGVVLFPVVMVLVSRLGGALDPNTPAGHGLLRRAEEEPPGPADDRLLRRVALEGLKTMPEFARAFTRPRTGPP